MRGPLVFLAGLCVLLGLVPGLLVPTLAQLGPGAPTHRRPGVYLPGTGGLPTVALALALLVGVGSVARRGWTPCRADPGLGVRAAGRARAGLDLGRVHEAAAADAERSFVPGVS